MNRCFKCGKFGHKQDTCWIKKYNIKRCSNCKKFNHHTFQCKFRPQNIKCSICQRFNHTAFNCKFKLRRAMSAERLTSEFHNEKSFRSQSTQTESQFSCENCTGNELNSVMENMEVNEDNKKKSYIPKFISERKF